MPKRRTFSPELKVRIALDALHGELTGQQIASKYKISTGQVCTFKKQAIANMTEGFERASPKARKKSEAEAPDVKSLHAKIGQLTMERDFLADGLQRIGISAKP